MHKHTHNNNRDKRDKYQFEIYHRNIYIFGYKKCKKKISNFFAYLLFLSLISSIEGFLINAHTNTNVFEIYYNNNNNNKIQVIKM